MKLESNGALTFLVKLLASNFRQRDFGTRKTPLAWIYTLASNSACQPRHSTYLGDQSRFAAALSKVKRKLLYKKQAIAGRQYDLDVSLIFKLWRTQLH